MQVQALWQAFLEAAGDGRKRRWQPQPIGGSHLIRQGDGIKAYWQKFVDTLKTMKLLGDDVELKPKGYSYYLRSKDVIRQGNVYLVGDSAGLATCDLGEGIGAAIQSGELAALSIMDQRAYELAEVQKYTSNNVIGAGIAGDAQRPVSPNACAMRSPRPTCPAISFI